MDPLLDNDRETNNESTAVIRQRLARQWTFWKAVFSAGSPADATMSTTMRSDVFYAVHAEEL
jgi:hypothetical protein